ncbi:tRNA (guanine-N(7)-)-methyltransferase [Buchnera aphidicola (Cinara cuneomaculata)]|uniref:tRNA (guanine-N(7)-)-methyltransferase n=1 Tax=Buchnera aphidicola (Cinara cuneomaculata) TaxID=1660040 RepID=A0A451CYA4_9GAMM|nr:tRNA (guanosine(46)-N7)-methyltransferase TrmB [Buchnera aphidicola]VFP78368.1 tRNA (guanine-N(7)-)-methyltransferase [Buchnera aphidicola (Cinara cuneomaculata)]
MIISMNNFFFKKKNDFSKSIKSYVTRRRNIKIRNIEYFLMCWNMYGINVDNVQLKLSDFFSLNQLYIIEIGFGDGQLFIEKALNNPHINFIGIEVHLKSVLTAIKYAYINNLKNVKIIFHDAVEVFIYMIPDKMINILQIFFPDPWFKTKHHKRRLINNFFIILILKKIIYKGFIHIVTDCPLYSKQIHDLFSLCSRFRRVFFETAMAPLLELQGDTKFKKKAFLLKKNIFDYKYQVIN